MTSQEQFELICQKALRKHYRSFRKVVADPFFVDSEATAQAQLTKMLRDVRAEVESSIYIGRRDLNSRQIAERILCDYLNMGRRYGERYYKSTLRIR